MNGRPPIYLDYNATTPLDGDVRSDLLEALDSSWANPSSVHRLGRHARAMLDEARDQVAGLWRCRPGEVVFTSGGTEANNLAVLGAARSRRSRGRHLLCSPLEHPAVRECHEFLARHEGFELEYLPVDRRGWIDPGAVRDRLRKETALVSLMAANNEIGTLQPVAEVGRICREQGVLFHTDAVQWFGKLPVDGIACFEADLVTCCAHKLHGPKGAGALYVRSPLQLVPVQLGGSHEHDRRAGTENLAAVSGLVSALRRFCTPPVFPEATLRQLRDRLAGAFHELPGVEVVAEGSERLPNTVAVTVEGADSIALLAALDLEGVCASSGSACSSGSLEPSRVLTAMGFPDARAASLVRFSLGRETTEAEIEVVCGLAPVVVGRVRGAG